MSPPTIQFNTFNESSGYLKKTENDSSNRAKCTSEKLFKTPNTKEHKNEKFIVRASSIPKLTKRFNETDKKSNLTISFAKKKSLSLMEIKRIRKSPRFPGDHKDQDLASNPLSPLSSVSMNDRYISHANLQLYKDYYYYVSDPDDSEVDYKLAGRKVFSSIMLYAWRLKRQEVRRLHEEVNKIKNASMKSKNQIHVISSLLKAEQRNNDDLNLRLRRCLQDQQKLQDTYNELNRTHSVLQLKLNSSKQALEEKIKESVGLNVLLSESKTNLFKSMARERELKICLSNEQRRALELENEKSELQNKIQKLEKNLSEKAEVENKLKIKSKEAERLQTELSTLEEIVKDLKYKESQVKEYEQLDATQRKIIQELTERIYSLEEIINNTYFSRAREFCSSFGKSSLACSHLLLHFLLPLTPHPPQLPVSISQKALESTLQFCWK